MGHSDPGAEADLSFGLDGVQFGQEAARIWRQRVQDLTVTARKQKTKHPRLSIIRRKVQQHKSCSEVLM